MRSVKSTASSTPLEAYEQSCQNALLMLIHTHCQLVSIMCQVPNDTMIATDQTQTRGYHVQISQNYQMCKHLLKCFINQSSSHCASCCHHRHYVVYAAKKALHVNASCCQKSTMYMCFMLPPNLYVLHAVTIVPCVSYAAILACNTVCASF